MSHHGCPGNGFLALLMAGLLMTALQRHSRIAPLVVVAVLVAEWALASMGVLGQWARRPPPFMVMIADVPYMWLPGVLAPVALLGHVLVLRRLRSAV